MWARDVIAYGQWQLTIYTCNDQTNVNVTLIVLWEIAVIS